MKQKTDEEIQQILAEARHSLCNVYNEMLNLSEQEESPSDLATEPDSKSVEDKTLASSTLALSAK